MKNHQRLKQFITNFESCPLNLNHQRLKSPISMITNIGALLYTTLHLNDFFIHGKKERRIGGSEILNKPSSFSLFREAVTSFIEIHATFLWQELLLDLLVILIGYIIYPVFTWWHLYFLIGFFVILVFLKSPKKNLSLNPNSKRTSRPL